jgi:hypothetical protein
MTGGRFALVARVSTPERLAIQRDDARRLGRLGKLLHERLAAKLGIT